MFFNLSVPIRSPDIVSISTGDSQNDYSFFTKSKFGNRLFGKPILLSDLHFVNLIFTGEMKQPGKILGRDPCIAFQQLRYKV